MAKTMKNCRVCGKQYPACKTCKAVGNNTFRWQEVACSPECGAIYLRQVMEARGQVAPEPQKKASSKKRPEASDTKEAVNVKQEPAITGEE